jgi:ABC-2 type transport system ATP-binding protein
VLGPNGAGKSTTVDMLLGLSTPDGGTISVFGKPPREAVVAGQISAMLQSGALLDDATVAEAVGLIAALHRKPMPVAQALEQAGIADLAGRRCTKLSGGQKQRVRFALALVCDPDLLVLDEPTVAMDVETRRAFWQQMRAYTDTGRTVLFATHYLEEAEEYADRVVLMRSGRIVADGSVARVRAAVSGRTLRAVVPGATDLTLPGVRSAERRGDQITLTCTDSDAAVRALLARYPTAHDIEITALGLEDAFLALTGEDN